jgi:hypothetical protein
MLNQIISAAVLCLVKTQFYVTYSGFVLGTLCLLGTPGAAQQPPCLAEVLVCVYSITKCYQQLTGGGPVQDTRYAYHMVLDE